MDPEPVIVVYSSSEEESGSDERKSESFDWISELLSGSDKECEDSDDCRVVGEVKANYKQRIKSSSDIKSSSNNDDDDDCVILEGDPDNSVSVVNDASGSDELLIVGEKGQIACKDFPHSRHLCGNFPFNSTSHQSHCDQCHCYVCDSLAPCLYWGTGFCRSDHCHATDKEDTWQLERRSFKLRRSASLPVSRTPDTSFIPVPERIPTLYQSELNAIPPSQVFRSTSLPVSRYPDTSMPRPPYHPPPPPITIRPCTSSTNYGIPNIISQVRSQQPGHVPSRNRFQPHLVSQQLQGVQNNSVHRRDTGHNVSGFQLAPSRAMFKRSGSFGGPLKYNRSGYNSSPYSRDFPQTATPADKNPVAWQGTQPGMNLDSGTHQQFQSNMGSFFPNTLPSQPSIYGPSTYLPPPQWNHSENIYQHGNPIQNGLSTSQSNQQLQVGNTPVQNAEPTEEPPLGTEVNSQSSAVVNPKAMYLDFEDWLLENPSVSGVSEATVPSQSNLLSPEIGSIDTGMLFFDFETSWNGLTRA